ncbi:MAG: hypothetical protein WDN69_11730 [Aliidongia sp.]
MAAAEEGYAPSERPVRAAADSRLPVGTGLLPLYLSQDWDDPLPAVTRAVIMLHGRRRDADTYRDVAENAARAAGAAATGSLLIIPQFLAGPDIRHHGLPADMLCWTLEGWMGGEPAETPAPISSFDALDVILARLRDRARLPNLQNVSSPDIRAALRSRNAMQSSDAASDRPRESRCAM